MRDLRYELNTEAELRVTELPREQLQYCYLLRINSKNLDASRDLTLGLQAVVNLPSTHYFSSISLCDGDYPHHLDDDCSSCTHFCAQLTRHQVRCVRSVPASWYDTQRFDSAKATNTININYSLTLHCSFLDM